jgi:hypothetical protein
MLGKRISTTAALSAPFIVLVALGAPQFDVAAADECLSAPSGATPKGQHWYYRLDRANQRKCWYLREVGPRKDQAQNTPAGEAGSTAKASAPPTTAAPVQSLEAKTPRARPSQPSRAPVQTAPVHVTNAGPEDTNQPRSAESNAAFAASNEKNSQQDPSPQPALNQPDSSLPTMAWPEPPALAAPPVQPADVTPIRAEPTPVDEPQVQNTPVSRSEIDEGAARGGEAEAPQTTGPVTAYNSPVAENALILALASLLAGLVYLIVKIVRQQVFVHPRSDRPARRFGVTWPRIGAKLSGLFRVNWGIRRNAAQFAPLPQQVTMARRFQSRRSEHG